MKKGQGAQINPKNQFDKHDVEPETDYLNYLAAEGEEESSRTEIIETFPKTIVNKVPSPDVPLDWSINPYQGCEHGCAYCYARPTHEFWGYSAGVDFERKILVKKNAAKLLEQKLRSKAWKVAPIMLSGNTDCYQPMEQKLNLTRECLEVFAKLKHPVGIITKNALIQRDLDVLTQLNQDNLVHLVISVTTLDEELRRAMEPRTASVARRIQTIEKLTKAGIPVSVNMAPIIPGLNSHEIFNLLKAVKQAGARDANYTMVRLNGPVAVVFKNWIESSYPNKSQKVLNQIAEMHDGQLGDSTFGRRMCGSGTMADQINRTFKIARKRVFGEVAKLQLNTTAFQAHHTIQLGLFD
ncbi:MAG: PA0069 family radical SAM protein [Salibacteraceae bacterium]